MKTTVTLLLTLATVLAHAEPVSGLLYSENFNAQHDRIEFRNGASLGGPGTGVSGKVDDRSYRAVLKTTENEPNGPAAMAISPITPDALSAFTVCFWYYLDEQQPELMVPLSASGILFLMQEKGFEVRIENQSATQPSAYVFTPGSRGPYGEWRAANRWMFAAFSWSQANNTLSIHQATPNDTVALMREMNRPLPATPTRPRTDLVRDPEVIGNTFRSLSRPLAGRMDDLRVYGRVLSIAELETIRKADISNAPVTIK